jgi:xanthosine utilization system XapX-like protein
MELTVLAIAAGLMIGFLRDLLKPEKPPKSPERRLGEVWGEVLEQRSKGRT